MFVREYLLFLKINQCCMDNMFTANMTGSMHNRPSQPTFTTPGWVLWFFDKFSVSPRRFTRFFFGNLWGSSIAQTLTADKPVAVHQLENTDFKYSIAEFNYFPATFFLLHLFLKAYWESNLCCTAVVFTPVQRPQVQT